MRCPDQRSVLDTSQLLTVSDPSTPSHPTAGLSTFIKPYLVTKRLCQVIHHIIKVLALCTSVHACQLLTSAADPSHMHVPPSASTSSSDHQAERPAGITFNRQCTANVAQPGMLEGQRCSWSAITVSHDAQGRLRRLLNRPAIATSADSGVPPADPGQLEAGTAAVLQAVCGDAGHHGTRDHCAQQVRRGCAHCRPPGCPTITPCLLTQVHVHERFGPRLGADCCGRGMSSGVCSWPLDIRRHTCVLEHTTLRGLRSQTVPAW